MRTERPQKLYLLHLIQYAIFESCNVITSPEFQLLEKRSSALRIRLSYGISDSENLK